MSENKLTSLMRINFLLKLNDFPIFSLIMEKGEHLEQR